MPGPSKMEKALQSEVETLSNLELRRDQASAVLGDEARITSSVRVAQRYLTKLDTAVTDYQQAVLVLLTAFDDDMEQKTIYMDKLMAQMQLVDLILNDQHNAVNNFKLAPLPPPEAANKTARILAVIKVKI